MYDYKWRYMTIYDFVWLCMNMNDYAWLDMTRYDYVWLYITMYYHVQTFVTIYDQWWAFCSEKGRGRVVRVLKSEFQIHEIGIVPNLWLFRPSDI